MIWWLTMWFWVVLSMILYVVPAARRKVKAPRAAPEPLPATGPPQPQRTAYGSLILPVASWPTTYIEEIVTHNGLAPDPYIFWRDKYGQTGDPADLEQMLRFVRRDQ